MTNHNAKLRVGLLVQHRLFDYRGVVADAGSHPVSPRS